MNVDSIFSEDSFWNQPIAADAGVDPRSDHLVALMDRRQGPIYINCDCYTIPVYEVDENVIYAEGLYGHPGRSWEDILDPDELRCIPLRHYRILELREVVRMGDDFHSAENRRRRQ
jgi:hypothetical protein